MGVILAVTGALVMALVTMPSSCCAYDFYVGSRCGWVEHPRESYGSWAGRNRFQVEDRLIFRYKQGSDSVLVVSETAYDSCNVSDSKKSYTDGNSVLQFDRSGPFYFISGAAGHCAQGQKLVVVVMAIRNHTTPPPPPSTTSSPAPSPYDEPPPPGTTSSPAPSPYNAPPRASPTPALAPSVAVPPTEENAPGTSAPEAPQIISSSASNVQAVSKGYTYLGVLMVAAMAVVRAFVG